MTREEAIKIMKEIDYPVNGDNKEDRDMAFNMAIEALNRLHGEWKPLGEPDDLGIHSWHICSSCGFRTTWHMIDIFRYCPNCGADMRREGGAE